MKYYLLCLALSLVMLLNAQIDQYYKSAFNTSGSTLKSELNNIISNHIQFPYTSSSTDVWDILKVTDRDINDSNNVILIYSGRSVNAAQEYNGAKGWSREHVWAKSRGDFGTAEGAGTDVHHLRPCDVSVNSTRNNRNFDDCQSCIDVIDNGFNTGSKRDASLWTFEPPDEVKGDIARMVFYMVVRYEGDGLEVDLEIINTLLGKADKSPLQAVKATLLAWNRLDTVSNWERNRNEIIYRDFQKNRNPFIDYPELAEYLWGDSIGEVWKPKLNTGIQNVKPVSLKVYPNPTNGVVNIDGEYKSIAVFDSLGRVKSIKTDIDLTNEPNGIYFIHIIDMYNKKRVFEIKKQ